MDLEHIGRYEILGEIGRGGMAIVYRAFDPRMEREVAVKFLPHSNFDLTNSRERFRREATVVANLIHPAIVPVYDFDDRDDQLYLVMQYMSGGSLVPRLSSGPISLEEIVHILSRIGPALDFAHEKGIVHRDLKPANILFDQFGEPFLADFGIVKMIEYDQKLTVTGSVLGTPTYMSPEQALGKTVDSRSDIYSLGIVLFQMLTGHLPYTADTPIVLANMHVNHPLPQLQAFNNSLPDHYQSVIDKAMAKRPEERYQTATDLYSDLYRRARIDFTYTEGQAAEEELSYQRPRLSRNWIRWILLFVLVIVSIIVAFGLLYFFDREQPPTMTATAGSGMPVAGNAPASITPRNESDFAEPSVAGGTLLPSQPSETTMPPVSTATISASATPTLTPTATLIPTLPAPDPILGSSWRRPEDGMVMVYVPAGQFAMGSTISGLDRALAICRQSGTECSNNMFDDESPQHLVAVDGFWIDQTEVTNAQFAEFLNRQGNQTEGSISWYQLNEPNAMIEMNGDRFQAKQGFENHPVNFVTWYAAQAYCQWAGGHLPTEAQWEYAAKGPEGTIFPWGNEFNEGQLNFCDLNCTAEWADLGVDDQFSQTSPISTYASNASWVGATDMAGNLWEWTNDWYGAAYYSTLPTENPAGPSNGTYKTLRGGSWISPEHYVRTTARYSFARRSYADPSFGLRCVH